MDDNNKVSVVVSEKKESEPPPTARRLLRIVAVFPFQFFPDELIVDEFKVTIVTRTFFFDTGRMRSVLFRDITGISLDMGLFFAALGFGERGFAQDKAYTNYLWKDQAVLARRLIEGMVILSDEKVDTTKLTLEELLERAEKLGREKGSR